MKDKFFSLLVDESTDVSSDKHVAFAGRYFSIESGHIETVYLGLAPMVQTTDEALFSVLESQLEDCGLDLKNCVGYSSDGANNMIGNNNSLWTRIKAAECTKITLHVSQPSHCV
jgi:hypothetical protein